LDTGQSGIVLRVDYMSLVTGYSSLMVCSFNKETNPKGSLFFAMNTVFLISILM
jgi:hypothetical protein